MRQIMFRAWDDINKFMWKCGTEGEEIGEYSFQSYFDPSTHCFEAVLVRSCDVGFNNPMVTEYKLPIMQYTGMKDKNFVKIFEGDIVSYKEFKYPLIIVFGKDDSCSFECLSKSGIIYSMDYELEVIGNIYQNKNLLEG